MTVVHQPAGGVDVGAARTPTSLELPEGLDFEDWRRLGAPLLELGHGIMWWIGDWLRYGETTYGATYTEAVEWTGLDYGTLANARYVATHVEPSRRREELSFGHHQNVAPLEADDQERLLAAAVKHDWSVQDLRTEVRRVRQGAVEAKATKAGRTTRSLVVTVADAQAEQLSAVLTAMADQLREELPDAVVDVR